MKMLCTKNVIKEQNLIMGKNKESLNEMSQNEEGSQKVGNFSNGSKKQEISFLI